MPDTTLHPKLIQTVPAHPWCDASTVAFIYIEHIPFRCTASTMQLIHFHEKGTADFRSPIPADSVVNPQAAPTGERVRIRPGDLLQVGAHTFEVYVPEGFDPIFPYLRRVAMAAAEAAIREHAEGNA